MKITHTQSGLPYHLKPGTQLEIERTNLFFNEWGEQSSPMELPDTEHNRELLGYPDLLGNEKKPSASISVTIEDDGYFMACRQAILGAQRKSSISTSFYMNEGSFLSRISNTSLAEVFGDETIPGVTTVAQGIDFCRSLINGSHPHFAIFPVLISSDEDNDSGFPVYKFINRYGYTDNYKQFQDETTTSNTRDFYNSIRREEYIDDHVIDLSPGFFMSPFVRANYLLKRIFQYFGYTLLDNFFTRTVPFNDMVFINNCADALVNGTIRLINLLPDCMCSTILELFRKKFCCEFIPNEANRTVEVKLFNEVFDSTPETDLSPFLISESIDFPESYQQLIISSDERLSDDAAVEASDSMALLLSKYPDATIDPITGCFTRLGYSYTTDILISTYNVFRDKISPSSMRYYAGGILKTKEIKVPDLQPEFRPLYYQVLPGMPYVVNNICGELLFIGEANFLNSKIILNSTTSEESSPASDSKSGNTALKPMLAFYYTQNNCPRGTITNAIREYTWPIATDAHRISDYSLCYNGIDGIFERFYRKYDDLLRNSLHKVKVKLLLPNTLKQLLPAHLPVILSNQKLFINNMRYQIGGKNEPLETEMLTMNLYSPISSAPSFPDYVPNTGYIWKMQHSVTNVNASTYENSPVKNKKLEPFYPLTPTAALAIPGQKYHVQSTCLRIPEKVGGFTYQLQTYWVECVKASMT